MVTFHTHNFKYKEINVQGSLKDIGTVRMFTSYVLKLSVAMTLDLRLQQMELVVFAMMLIATFFPKTSKGKLPLIYCCLNFCLAPSYFLNEKKISQGLPFQVVRALVTIFNILCLRWKQYEHKNY